MPPGELAQKLSRGPCLVVTPKSPETAPMSHRLFQGSIFSNARVWAFLTQVDEAEAARCRSAGCAHCGAVLHSATYPRKPHGLAPELREGCPALQLLLRRLPAPREAAVGALLRATFPRGAVVPCGERTGSGRRRAPADDRAALGGSARDAEALAALVAGGLPRDPGVAGQARRAGGAARRAGAAPVAAHHAGPRPAGAAAAEHGLADAVDRVLRARRRSGFARRKRFCHAPIGRRIIATSTKQRGGMAQ